MPVTWPALGFVALAIFGVARIGIGLLAYLAGYMKPVPDVALARNGCVGVAIGIAALILSIWGLVG